MIILGISTEVKDGDGGKGLEENAVVVKAQVSDEDANSALAKLDIDPSKIDSESYQYDRLNL